jgi:hypothetical protein
LSARFSSPFFLLVFIPVASRPQSYEYFRERRTWQNHQDVFHVNSSACFLFFPQRSYFIVARGRPKALSAFFSHLLLWGSVAQLFTESFFPLVTLAASEPGTKTEVLGSRLSMIACAAGEI